MLKRRSGPCCFGADMALGLILPIRNQLLKLVPFRNGATGRRSWPWTRGVIWLLGCSQKPSRTKTVRAHEGTCKRNRLASNPSTVDIRPTIAITKAHMKVCAPGGEVVQKLTWNSSRSSKKVFARGDCKQNYCQAARLRSLHGF